MAHYIARRIVWVIFVLLAVTLITYAIFFLLPAGDPAVRHAGKIPSEANVAEIRQQFGLDRPVYVQYGKFVRNFFGGDEYGWPGLGFSYETRTSVRDKIATAAPRTLWLIAGAAVLWLIGGIAIGVVSAVRRRSLLDRAAMLFALFGISAPVFWLGLLLLFVFWEKLGLLPGTGYVPIADGPFEWFKHLILPWCVLALAFAAVYARMTRGNLLETMGEDYIRTARAKGLSERRVVLKHGLRSSLTPIITLLGIDIAVLVGGAVITERVFNIQGLGHLAVTGVFDQDLPVTQGVILVGAGAVAIMSLVADIVHARLDPRVRFE